MAIDHEALARIEKLKALEVAAEEKFNRLANEQKKLADEQEEQMNESQMILKNSLTTRKIRSRS